jgi:hypothetical protein
MNNKTEFEEIGRKSTYKVPDGFFEQVSEKTLRMAKQREQNHRKRIIMLQTFAVAASLSAIAFLGYFMLKPEPKQIVQVKQTEVKQETPKAAEINKQIALAESTKVTPVKTITKATMPEELTDILADLSDDELLEMAAVYKSDPFIEESQH